jgi:hypothetical protein
VSRSGSERPGPGEEPVSERDLELLSAYHDRELSALEQWRLWRRLRAEPALRRARERIARLGSFARTAFVEEQPRDPEWSLRRQYQDSVAAFHAWAPALLAERDLNFQVSDGLRDGSVSDVILAERLLANLLESLGRIAIAHPSVEADLSAVRDSLLVLRKRLAVIRRVHEKARDRRTG